MSRTKCENQATAATVALPSEEGLLLYYPGNIL